MPLTIIRALVDPLAHIQSFAVPGFVRFLSVEAVQGDRKGEDGTKVTQPAVFALGDLEQPAKVFSLRVYHTGHAIPTGALAGLEYLGTAASREGRFVAHLFLVVKPPAPDPMLALPEGQDAISRWQRQQGG